MPAVETEATNATTMAAGILSIPFIQELCLPVNSIACQSVSARMISET
jgi:hypothetical protein